MSNTGIVFNIQKFSVNDGPGIRTVVFLKGCPLRCKWCSNPESQKVRPEILWDVKKCLGCGHCVAVCPEKALCFENSPGRDLAETALRLDDSPGHGLAETALRLEDSPGRGLAETALRLDDSPGHGLAKKAICLENSRLRVRADRCSGCGICQRECPGKALKNEGERRTVEDVMAVVLQDLPFYEESGGGITLSGGEMLAQPDFAKALLSAAKENGLHTCCETTGFAAQDVFASVVANIDTILFDVKHWDGEKHREGTGVGNELILANLRYAVEAGKEVLPRIPVIPGFNDSLEDAEKLSAVLKEAGVSRCQLLPFHQFGEGKYDRLGREYAYKDVNAYHREDLEEYRKRFLALGVEAFF